MPRINEPTYSKSETQLFEGTCLVANNIFNIGVFGNNIENYSKVIGTLIYYIAGWGIGGDADIAGNIVRRYGKALEENYGTKIAVKQIKILNRSYQKIRAITEKTMKRTLDVDIIINSQVIMLLNDFKIETEEKLVLFLTKNIQYFTSIIIEKNPDSMQLPSWDDSIKPGHELPMMHLVSQTQNTNVIKSFYKAVSMYDAGWLSFRFNFRIPVGFIVGFIYIILCFIQKQYIYGCGELLIFAVDFIMIYKIMKRNNTSRKWLYVEFIYVFLLSVLTQTPSTIIASFCWTIFNCIYFYKHINFFDSEFDTVIFENKTNENNNECEKRNGIIENKSSDTEDYFTYEEIKFCRICGAKLIEGASFCNKCGEKLGALEPELDVEENPLTTKSNGDNALSNSIDDAQVESVRKWKALYDEGIITKEEFDIKRKDILKI